MGTKDKRRINRAYAERILAGKAPPSANSPMCWPLLAGPAATGTNCAAKTRRWRCSTCPRRTCILTAPTPGSSERGQRAPDRETDRCHRGDRGRSRRCGRRGVERNSAHHSASPRIADQPMRQVRYAAPSGIVADDAGIRLRSDIIGLGVAVAVSAGAVPRVHGDGRRRSYPPRGQSGVRPPRRRGRRPSRGGLAYCQTLLAGKPHGNGSGATPVPHPNGHSSSHPGGTPNSHATH